MIIQFLFVYEYLKSPDREKIFRWRTSARVGPHTPYVEAMLPNNFFSSVSAKAFFPVQICTTIVCLSHRTRSELETFGTSSSLRVRCDRQTIVVHILNGKKGLRTDGQKLFGSIASTYRPPQQPRPRHCGVTPTNNRDQHPAYCTR